MKASRLLLSVSLFAEALLAFANGDGTDLTWVDAEKSLCGKGYAETIGVYGRVNAADASSLSDGVRWNGRDSAGLCLRFTTDSSRLAVKWNVSKDFLGANMNAFCGAGVDIYRRTPTGWHFVGAECGSHKHENRIDVDWHPGDEALIYLPLYNEAKDVQIGVRAGARVTPCVTDARRPVVFYGTSITQGGCASRPGMAYTAILQRRLNVPVVNLGFSGAGCMEPEMADSLARVNASVYVIDTMWNINADAVRNGTYERFLRRVRQLRPDVPILLVNDYHFAFHGKLTEKGKVAQKLHARLAAEPVFGKSLVLVDCSDLYDREGNGTVDGTHPDSYGMMLLARKIAPALKPLLEKKGR